MLLLVYALLVGVYFVARAGGYWAENDTAALSLAMRVVERTGSLTTGAIYGNGYGYSALSVFLVSLSGVSVATLQQVLYPLLSALLVIPAWALYRELTGTGRAATLASVLLFTQPEFMFVILRGSHERLLRFFMLMMLWLLARSFRLRHEPRQFALHVILFYACAYGLVSTNAFFATSFVLACALAMLGGWGLGHVRPRVGGPAKDTARRLAIIGPAVLVLGFVFIFYIYPVASRVLVFEHNLAQQTAAVTLTTEGSSQAVNPYNLVVGAWISLPVYAVISVGDYLLMAAGAAVWLWQGWQWLRGANAFPTVGRWLLWLFFASFALQGGAAVLADRTGLLGGNLEYRAFPSFAMMAAPLAATAITAWRPARVGAWAGGTILGILAGIALLKATNEPALSNVWTYYTRDELAAMSWADAHLRASAVWSGFDGRLNAAYGTAVGNSSVGNLWESGDSRGASAHTFLISNTIRLQAARFLTPLPEAALEDRVYDSGSVQIYHLLPRTPYQS